MEQELHYEIERKYLIAYPSEEALAAMPGARMCDITQTYLLSEAGERRVRKIEEAGHVTYVTTFKQKVSGIRRIEIEEEITEETYAALLTEADPDLAPLRKRRYTIPYGIHTAEIDLYPFLTDRAILEIELPTESTPVTLPPFLTTLREVTDDPTYKNPVLARRVALMQREGDEGNSLS